MSRVDKVKLVELAMPILAIYLAWFFVVGVTVAGVWLSLSYEDWSIFARFGSVVVVIALLLAVYDHFSWARSLSTLSLALINEQVDDIFVKDIREALENHGIEKSESEISYLAEQKSKAYHELFPYRFSHHLKSLFQRNELLIGVYGTLVWGFGDLIGNII